MFLLMDESFDIRSAAVTLLGSLASINPATVLPDMRCVLKQLIENITTCLDSRQKQEAVLTVGMLLKSYSLQRLVKPFVGTLIRVMPLTTAAAMSPAGAGAGAGAGAAGDVRLTTAALKSLGDIFNVIRLDALKYTSHLLPLIIYHVFDRSVNICFHTHCNYFLCRIISFLVSD